MLTKKITYTDYNGNERTETFYFNLSKAELTKLQLTYPGGFAEHIEQVVDARDTAKVVDLFNEIIDLAYGEKSEDGRRLVKSKELTDAFKQTEAYDQLFMELITDEDVASKFVNGILPDFGEKESEKQELIAKTKARIEGKSQQGSDQQ